MAKKNDATVATQEQPETGLSVLENSRFLAIRPNSDIAEAMQANLAGGETIKESDLIRVKVPGSGGTRWTIPTAAGEEVSDEVVGVLVYYSTRGVLWPSMDPGNAMPVLISDDLRTARKVGDDIGDLNPAVLDSMHLGNGVYDFRGTAEGGKNIYNDFGSGKNGIGKRAKESRVMCLLRENEAFPLLINAPPGSLKTVAPFVKRLPVAHYRAVVSLKLHKIKSKGGIDYAQIVPTMVAQLSLEEGRMIQKLYTTPLRGVIESLMPEVEEYASDE